MKKAATIIFLLSFLVSAPLSVEAIFDTIREEGIVPCGPGTHAPDPPPDHYPPDWGYGDMGGYIICEICHLFELIARATAYLLVFVIPPVAAIFVAYGGIVFYTAGGSPEKIARGKKILISVVTGLIIIYSAHFLVSMLISALGVGDVVQWPVIEICD